METEGAATPKLRISTAGSRPDMVTVMPAAEPCETTFVTVKMDNNFTLDSPDHHEAPPTCMPTWNSQEIFTEVEQPSKLCPDDTYGDSSSTCAEDEHHNDCLESTADQYSSDDSSSTRGVDRGDTGGSEGRWAAQGRASLPPRVSNEIRIGHSSSVQVPGTPSTVGAHGRLLPDRPVGTMAEANSAVQPEAVAAAIVGAPWWTVGQKRTITIVALGMLALGMCIGRVGAHDRHAASSARAPATALIPYGHPIGRRPPRSLTLGGKLDVQVLAAEHMRIAEKVMLEMHEAWAVLAAAAAHEDLFNGRGGSGWPRVSQPNETVLPSGDLLYIRTFDRPSFNYRSISEELMSGPWV